MDFNTDYWSNFPPALDQYGGNSGVTGQAPNQGNPALPAMAWIGVLIALVAIRFLSEMD